MKLQSLTEKALISAIKEDFFSTKAGIFQGIGDDAAVIKVGNKRAILTKDLLIEGSHFLSGFHAPYFLGRKSINVNLSDIAAMGGVPEYVLLGLGIPLKQETEWIEQFFSGVKSVVQKEKIALIGGDVVRAQKVTISVTVIGKGEKVIKRSGAKPGHILYVSGTLGDAAQGLRMLKKGIRLGSGRRNDFFLKTFLDPVPQIELGQMMSRSGLASAMIDISDGLSVDTAHICQESGCGAEIFSSSIPVSSQLSSVQKYPHAFALQGGEDYQLLFSVPPEKTSQMFKVEKKFQVTPIGHMIKEKNIFLIDKQNRRKELVVKGFQHF
jgi:thiamine-monophosphate kinase